MANPVIQIKRSAVAGKIPTTSNLQLGELAVNTYDGKVYLKQDQGAVGVGTTVIAVNPWSVGVGSVAYNTYFTAGSVGVGTNNPSQKLEVVGGEIKAGRIDTSSEGGQLSFGRSTDNNTAWYIDLYGSTSTPSLRFVDVSNAAIRALFDGSGNFLVNSATATGTASQPLQVTGGSYISGSVGIGTTNPPDALTTLGRIQIQQDSGSNNRLVFRGQPGSLYRWNIDNYSSSNDFRIFREDDATTSNGVTLVSISTAGTLTATKFSGDGSLLTGITASVTYAPTAGIATYATTAGVSTSVIGGIGSITQLSVSGISTFTNGPVLVGSATSTGTALQRLQVTGNGYFSNSIGIGTTNPTKTLVINGGNGNISIGTVSTANAIWLNNSTASTDYNILSNSANNLNINRPSGKSIFFNQADTTTHATFDASNNFILNSGNLALGNFTPTYNIDGGAASLNAKGRVGSIIFGTAGTSYGIVGYNAKPSGLNAWQYDVTDVASWVQFLSGGHVFYRAVSGTAGNAITPLESARFDANGNLGIGSASPSVTLDVVGNAKLTGVITATTFSGTATYATSAGIATYSTSSGIATYATTAGVSTYSSTAGIATYATSSGIATYAPTAGIATYSTISGISTSVIGGIASVTSLSVSGISTLGVVKISSGIITATSGILTYYGDGSKLINVSISTTAPAAPIAGNLWYNSNYGRIYIYYNDGDSSQWVDAAPFNIGIVTSMITTLTLSQQNATSPSLSFTNDTSTGLFSPATGQQTFVSSGASVLNINPSGLNITGIVTASSFSGNATSATYATIAGYSTSSGVSTSVIGGISSVTQLNVSGISTHQTTTLIGSGTSTGTANQILQVAGISSGVYIGGNLGIGTTNPTSKLHVVGNALITGIVTATDFNSTSDYNLKVNIKSIDNPLEKVLKINGVSFDWKHMSQSSAGVIAQDVEKVLPEIVRKDTDGYKSLNYNGLIGLLIEAVKEQQKQIDELREQINHK